MKNFSLSTFRSMFPTDDAALAYIFESRIHEFTCKCSERGLSAPVWVRKTGRKVYSCKRCGTQVSPLAGTIMHGSSTPVTLWLYAMFKFSTSKNGVSAKELQRELGVTYKCAWRMGNKIRSLFLTPNNDVLSVKVLYDYKSSKITSLKRDYIAIESLNKKKAIPNNYFGQLKRSLDGTFHYVSPKYLDSYLQEFAFKVQRSDTSETFYYLLEKALIPVMVNA